MAILDKTGGNSEFPWVGREKRHVVTQEIDLAGVATADVVQALKVPAKSHVENFIVEIVTPTVLTVTALVGDGADPNGFDNAIDLNASAGTRTKGIGGTDAFITAGGKFYDSADTIDLTLTVASGPIVTGKIRVTMLINDLS